MNTVMTSKIGCEQRLEYSARNPLLLKQRILKARPGRLQRKGICRSLSSIQQGTHSLVRITGGVPCFIDHSGRTETTSANQSQTTPNMHPSIAAS